MRSEHRLVDAMIKEFLEGEQVCSDMAEWAKNHFSFNHSANIY